MKIYQYLVLFIFFYISSALAAPVGTQFTYQGELKQAGVAASGLYDFEFQLFNAAAGGAPVSVILQVNNINLDEGLFTTTLDFGDAPFTGDAVFLEINVKEDSAGSFNALSPRQPLTPTPYSIQSEFVGMNGVDSVSIVNNSITAADIAPNSVGNSEIINTQVQQRVIGTCPAGQAVSMINQDGSVNCQAAGTDTDWNETASTVWTDKNVAIGDSDATIGSGTFAVHGPSPDTFGGMFVNVDGTGSEQPFYGYATNNAFRAWTEFNEATDQWRVNINNGYRLYVTSSGQLGVNESNPQATLHVDGSIRFEDLGIANTTTVPLRVEPDGDVVPGPSTYTLSINPSAFTVEESNDNFQKILGSGHAFISAGFGGLSAPVNLPDGATVLRVDVWYVDESTENLTLRLRRSPHASVNNQDLSAILPTGSAAGVRSASDTSINFNPITNTTHSYYFRAFSSNWTGVNMGIKAVLITYRL